MSIRWEDLPESMRALIEHEHPDLKAFANVEAIRDAKAKSGPEERWEEELCSLWAAEQGLSILWMGFEAWRFYLDGGSYLPDFAHVMSDGSIHIVEIKGSKQQQSYRDSRAKLRAAAVRYPFLTWWMALINKDGLHMELINKRGAKK